MFWILFSRFWFIEAERSRKFNRALQKYFLNVFQSYASSTFYDHFRFRHEEPIFWFAIALSWLPALYCLWRRQLFCRVIFSLGPGSTVGEKGKKPGQTGKILANEASPSAAWEGGKGGTLSHPHTTSRFASPADFFSAQADFFPFSPIADQTTMRWNRVSKTYHFL